MSATKTAKPRRVKVIPIATFIKEVLAEYAPPRRTALTYARMKQTLDVLERTPRVRTTADLTPKVISAYVKEGDWGSESTIKNRLNLLRAAFGVAIRKGLISSDPFGPRSPGQEKQLAAPLGTDDVASLLDHLRDGAAESWVSHRLYVLVCLVVFKTFRLSEAVALTLADYDRKQRRLTIAGGTVALDQATAAVLDEWVAKCEPGPMFPPAERSDGSRSASYSNLCQELVRESRYAGVGGVTFMSLRRYGNDHAAELAAGPGPRIVRRSIVPVSITRFSEEVLSRYESRNDQTRWKVGRVLDVLAQTPGVRNTADLTSEVIPAFVKTGGWINKNTIETMIRCLKSISVIAVRNDWSSSDLYDRRRRLPAPAAPHNPLDRKTPRRRPARRASKVVIGPDGSTPLIDGKPRSLKTKAQRRAVKRLIDAGRDGISREDLGKDRLIINRLREADDVWASMIKVPGEPWGGKYYIL